MQRANPVPVRRLLGEIGRGLLAPGLAGGLEAEPVGAEGRVGGVEPADEVAGERAALVGEAKEGPRPLALPRGEARLDEQLQMAGDARLGLAENGDQLADGELGRFEQAEDPEPCLLTRRRENGEQRGKGHGRRRMRHKHIFMSKPTDWQAIPARGAHRI